jgi:glycerol-3-phosphate dehydrogenase subunit B
MNAANRIDCDLLVIGQGMAGMSAALFAANRGLSTVQVGFTGELVFASGLLDLMAVHPLEPRKVWHDPWAAISALAKDIPEHPYARLTGEQIRRAFDECLAFLERSGLPYRCREKRNCRVLTTLGTVKETYAVPASMWPGVKALSDKRPCLLVGFHGLNDFCSELIAGMIEPRWPNLRPVRIAFPGVDSGADLFAGDILAQRLELSQNQTALAEALKPHRKEAEVIGLPAILGVSGTRDVISELEMRLGVEVFEIPTLPVSVAGLRLKEAFNRKLSERGVRVLSQSRVLEVGKADGAGFVLNVGNKSIRHTVRAKGVILASGRFWGRGLYAGRNRIREAVFDLPVHQPQGRREWHRDNFLDSRGHPVNRAGVEIDDSFRPLDRAGRPVFDTLFAAGSILAHQDWMRMKCGSGLAIATAYGAVSSFLQRV